MAIFDFLLIAAFLLIIAAFIYSQIKIKDEYGKESLFEEQCGGRFNSFGITFPFVRHSIYYDFIVISKIGRKFKLPINKVNEVEVSIGLLPFSKVRYSHSIQEIPKRIIIRSRSPELIKKTLTKVGVTIK